MRGRVRVRAALAEFVAVAVLAGCGQGSGDVLLARGAITSTTKVQPPATTTTAVPTTTTAPPPTTVVTTTAPPPPLTEPPAPEPPPPPADVARPVYEQPWLPFATVAELLLLHPSYRVERVGFHESNHDGAQELSPVSTAANPITLETRNRDTNPRGAADVVVDPAAEIRAPVTGTVIRSGTYVLYCDYTDDYVVIEPDAHPGWEVKVLHISGVQVGRGERVEAGLTVLAPGPTILPFPSQVDEVTTAPAWPHVHIEVVDPSIPDRPSDDGCS